MYQICLKILVPGGMDDVQVPVGGGGAGPPQIFSEGGWDFSTPGGASLGQISILKIIIFLMIFLSFFGIFI